MGEAGDHQRQGFFDRLVSKIGASKNRTTVTSIDIFNEMSTCGEDDIVDISDQQDVA